MPVPVGGVYATFEVRNLEQARAAIEDIAAKLQQINNTRITLGGDFDKLVKAQSQGAQQTADAQKRADQASVKSAEEAMARRARLDKELTRQSKSEADQRLKIAQQNDKAEAASAAEKSKLKQNYEKAWGQAIAENAKRDAAAAQQSAQNWRNFMGTVEKAGAAPAKVMQGLSNGILGVARSLEHTGQIAAIFGYRMSLVASPLYALGAAGGKAAIDLEAGVKRAATQLDDLSPANIEKFTKDVTANLRQLSTEFPKTASDMADAVYYLVSTLTIDPGVAAQMIKPIAEFSTAIKSSTLDSAKAVTPILNVYKEYADGADGIQKALGAMFETIRRGKGEASDIARQVGDFLAYGKTAGATLQEQLAIFAQLTRIAGSPSEASTQLSALFRGLTDDKTIEKLGAAGIAVSQAVEGTGEWIRTTGALDKESKSAYDSIIKKLQGADGITGLYGQLSKAQTELARNESDYAGKQSVANARALEDSRQKVALLKAQIGVYQQQKAAIEGGEDALVFTGEMKFRNIFDIIADIGKYLDQFQSEEQKLVALQGILPNVRAVRGILSLFTPGALTDVQRWAAEMENATGRVQDAATLMGDTLESKLTKTYNSLTATTGKLFDDFIRERLVVLLGKVKDFLDAFNSASPALKEMLIQLVLIGTAAGPASLAFGTFVIALSQVFALIGFLVSPIGLVALALGIVALEKPLGNVKSALDQAGGGMTGLAKLAGALAVELGLVKDYEVVAFLDKMGVSLSGIELNTLREEVKAIIADFKEFADGINNNVITPIKNLVQFIAEHKEIIVGLGEAITIGVGLSKAAEILLWLGTLQGGIAALGTTAAVAGGAGGVGFLGAALATLPPKVTITIILAGLAVAFAGLMELEARINALTGRKSFGEEEAAHWLGPMQNPPASYGDLESAWAQGRKPSSAFPAGPTAGAEYDPYWWRKGAPYQSTEMDPTRGYVDENGVYHPPTAPPINAADYDELYGVRPYSGGMTGGDVAMYDELYGTRAGAGTIGGAAAARRLGSGKPPTGGSGGAAGMGIGRPVSKKIMTPQEMAPSIFAQFAGAGWAGAYAQEHGGRDPFSDYQSQGYTDPIGAALRDKAWGDEFFKKEGRAAEKGDWETHWYQTYAKQTVPELDAEGKPTGKTKTVIKEQGAADEFSKIVEEAMKGVTEKKDELTAAYKDPPQALIDKKEEITQAYLDPITAFKDGVTELVEWLKQKLASVGGGKPPAGSTPPPADNTGGPGFQRDYGGTVTTSGVYRLLKGEYVLSMPEQRDVRSMVRGASYNQRGGDSYGDIVISGANANPREIAAAVIAEINWQKSRRSGKMVY